MPCQCFNVVHHCKQRVCPFSQSPQITLLLLLQKSINDCRHNAPARSRTLYVMLQAEADTNEFIRTADWSSTSCVHQLVLFPNPYQPQRGSCSVLCMGVWWRLPRFHVWMECVSDVNKINILTLLKVYRCSCRFGHIWSPAVFQRPP